MKNFKKIISGTTYVILMLLGMFFLLGFFFLGTLVGLLGKEFINIIIDFFNSALKEASTVLTYNEVEILIKVLNFIPGVSVSLVDASDFLQGIQVDSIPSWSMWIIATPFYIFSLLGVIIILLTQRTTTSRSKIKKIKIILKNLMGENFEEMNVDQLRSFLQEKNISYKQKYSKQKLLKIIDKKFL